MKYSIANIVGLALVVSPIVVSPTIAAAKPAKAVTKASAKHPAKARTKSAATPAKAPPRAPDPAFAAAMAKDARGDIAEFYQSRGYRPLWIDSDSGKVGRDAQSLLRYLDDAQLDGLRSSRYKPEKLRALIAQADSGAPQDLALAELALSQAFARYISDVRKIRKNVGYDFADPDLKPKKQSAAQILRVAANSVSFREYMSDMDWMSPLYARTRGLLRAALEQHLPDQMIDVIELNRERARYLPPPTVRHILVDAASARLWYFQAGRQAGTMKVVVGAKETQTPLLVGAINYAILNPYWNIPDYLVRDNVAKKIVSGRTLDSMHMEVLSDWSANPARLDPASIDWASVAAGRGTMPRVRELPGPANSMGKVKFVFPNDEGIYLHDSPNRPLFDKDDRHLSNGCIRLEKAWVLGEWMMGNTLSARAKKAPTEDAVPLAASVPVYLTYITVVPTADGVGILPDIYGRDSKR